MWYCGTHRWKSNAVSQRRCPNYRAQCEPEWKLHRSSNLSGIKCDFKSTHKSRSTEVPQNSWPQPHLHSQSVHDPARCEHCANVLSHLRMWNDRVELPCPPHALTNVYCIVHSARQLQCQYNLVSSIQHLATRAPCQISNEQANSIIWLDACACALCILAFTFFAVESS